MEFRIFEHGVVDSTSDRAFAALAEGSARHGDVHVATGQTAGRGRRGSRWESAPGEGLYASVVLLPRRPLDPVALTMAAGLAVRAALADLGLARARLKWPNDLLVDGAKISGILAETRGLDPAAPHCVVGLGVNVAQQEFPRELASLRAVTSLALCGVRTTSRAALDCLLPHFGREVERAEATPEATCREYFTALLSGARRVRVLAGEDSLAGEFRSADPARGLELVLADGSTRRVRLEHVRALEVVDD